MKRIAPICLAALTACSVGGGGHSQSAVMISPLAVTNVVLHFQSGFDRTPLQLHLDGEEAFSGILTTDNRIGAARSMTFTVRDPQNVTAVIVVNGTERYSYPIKLSEGRYIGFSRDLDSGKLKMVQSQQQFQYD